MHRTAQKNEVRGSKKPEGKKAFIIKTVQHSVMRENLSLVYEKS